MNFFVFIGFILFVSPAFSQTNQQKILYQVGDQMVEETFQISADQWPDLVERRYQPIAKLARTYFSSEISSQSTELAPEMSLISNVGYLWEAKNSWNWEWEVRYAQWIQKEVDTGFLKRYGVATDCADVAYALRWIFARIHSLPMSSRLATGHWFTHKSLRAEWKRLPTAPVWHQDKRFLKALNYLLDLTYTHSLARDTYPVAIQEASLLEGTIQLYINNASGHTQVLTKVRGPQEPGIPVEVLQSTVPRAERDLFGGGYWNRETQPEGKGGLVRFRWPQGEKLVPAEEMPFFSREQYLPSFTNGKAFFLAIFERIQPGFSFLALLDRLYADILAQLEERRAVVEQGYEFCRKNSCEPGTPGDENWSTPSRDKRLLGMIRDLEQIGFFLPDRSHQKYVEELFRKPAFPYSQKLFSIETIAWLLSIGFASPDPRLAPEYRWALGTEKFRNVLYQKAVSLWESRQKKVKKIGVCSPGLCKEGSQAWIKNSTMEEDLALRKLKVHAAYFCAKNSPQECAEWTALRNSSFPITDAYETLEMALGRFLFLNSDPRVPVAKRTLDPWSGKKIVIAPFAARMFSNGTDLIFADSGREREIWNISGKPRRYSFSERILAMDLQYDRVWLLANATLISQSIRQEGDRTSIPIPFDLKQLQVLGDGKVLALGDQQWAVLHAESGGLNWIASGNFERLLHLDRGHFILFHPNPVYYDFTSGNFAGVPLPEEAKSIDQYWADQTENGWFFRNNDPGYYNLRKGSGEWLAEPNLRFLLASKDGRQRLTYENGKVILQSYHQNGQKISERQFAGGSVYSNGDFVRVVESNHYFIRGRNEISIVVLKDGSEIYEVNDNRYLVREGSEFRLKELATERVLYRTTEILHFPRQTNSNHILSCIENDPQGNWDNYRMICRLVDFTQSERVSILTGLSPMRYRQRQSSSIQHGNLFNYDDIAVWIGEDLSSL